MTRVNVYSVHCTRVSRDLAELVRSGQIRPTLCKDSTHTTWFNVQLTLSSGAIVYELVELSEYFIVTNNNVVYILIDMPSIIIVITIIYRQRMSVL